MTKAFWAYIAVTIACLASAAAVLLLTYHLGCSDQTWKGFFRWWLLRTGCI